jgi:hypothetical protein
LSRLDKQLTLTFLRPWAMLAGLVIDPCRRTCAHARLSAKIHTRSDPYVVISRSTPIVALARSAITDGAIIGEYTSMREANQRVGTGGPIRTSGHDALTIDVGRHVWITRSVALLPERDHR